MESVAENLLAAQLAEEADEERKEQMAVVDFKMVTFSLAGKDYAIDIMKVKEIAKAGRFTYVPNTSPFVLGVYNLRGEIIPILDLRLFFNVPVPEADEKRLENLEQELYEMKREEMQKKENMLKKASAKLEEKSPELIHNEEIPENRIELAHLMGFKNQQHYSLLNL